MRIILILAIVGGIAFGAAFSLGCCSAPGVTQLPADEDAIEVVGPAKTDAPPPQAVAQAAKKPLEPPPPVPAVIAETIPEPRPQPKEMPARPTPAPAKPAATPIPAETTYAKLKLKRVKGGQLTYAAAGTVEEILAMLVDFDHAQGHRAWAQSYKTLRTDPAGVLARWKFKGKLGITPTVHLLFHTKREGKNGTVTYELKKRSLGIASFFGDFKVTPLAGSPSRSQIVQRAFIDSGLPFANASRSDIEKGLREDARLIRLWMQARTSK